MHSEPIILVSKYGHYLGNNWRLGVAFGANFSELNVQSQKQNILSDPLLINNNKKAINGAIGLFRNTKKYVLGIGVQTFGVADFWGELRLSNQFGWIFSDKFEWYNNLLYQPKIKSLLISSTIRYYLFSDRLSVSATLQKDTFFNFQTLGFHLGVFHLDGYKRTKVRNNSNLDLILGISYPTNAIKIQQPSIDLKVTFNFNRINL